MAKKQKAKRTKKYSGNRARAMSKRQDYRKGGRVSLRHGGPHGAKKTIGEPRFSNEEPTLINDDNNRRIPVPEPVQPTSTFTQAPTTGKSSDQMFIGRTDQETRTPQLSQAQTSNRRKQLEDLGYDEADIRDVLERDEIRAREQAQAQTTAVNVEDTGGPMSRQDFFTQYGNYEGVTRGSAAAKRRNEFNAARQQAYEDYLRSFSTQSTTTPGTTTTTQQQTEEQQAAEAQAAGETTEQKQATRTRVEEGMQGIVPDAAKIPDAEKIDSTIAQKTTTMAEPTDAQTFQASDQPKEAVATSTAAQADETIGQDLKANTMQDIATVGDKDVAVDAAQGTVTRGPIGDIQGQITGDVKSASVDTVKAEAAKAKNVEDILTGTYLVDEVEGEDTTVNSTPDAERQERETILGEPAPDGVAAAINDTVGYTAAKQRPVKGQAAQSAAANMIAETADLPPEISSAIVQDPATVTAQIDNEPVEVQAAVAALPTEALVSSQMESLLGGMEDGEVPAWAKPAVDAVNAGMARRGLSVSTVGRDALFNAIIQSALPMAQSNATALQQRATQNLSNQQQANLQEATQAQQLKLANLANRQSAESQTAQMSQQMKVMQSQFDQQAVMTTADQQQQTRTQNLQNQQQAAVIQSQNEQQMRMQNLGNEQQVEMAELQIEANVEGANQAAENQEKIAEMQVAADFLSKNAAFKQQMDVANLSNDQQMRLANLSSRNLAASETLSNAEKTELANLNKTMQTNQLQAQIASQMNLAQLNVDQQSAIQNATTKANMDMTKFNAAQQVELANSKFMQTVALTDMNAEQQAIMQNATAMASMDLANLSTRERLAVTNAQNFLAMDMANLNNNQQANMMKAQQEQQRLLSDQASINAAKQFNASSQNQTDQFMASMAAQMSQYNTNQTNSMAQFNDSQTNAAAARDSQRAADVEKFNTQLSSQVDQFNANQDFARNQWNAQNEAIVEQSNVEWRRKSNAANTAAQNAINMQNAQNSFNLSQTSMSFLWQEMRDQADYDFRAGENEKNRISQIVNTALASDPSKYGGSLKNIQDLIGAITGDLFG